jgi:hypothetical protein
MNISQKSVLILLWGFVLHGKPTIWPKSSFIYLVLLTFRYTYGLYVLIPLA